MVDANDCTVNVWSLSTFARHHRMTAATALKKEQLVAACVFVVTVDLARPWRVLRCLETWCAELDAAVAAAELPAAEAAQLQRKQREYVQQRYANGIDGALPDLPEGVLGAAETPHGVPLVVVGTNSDSRSGAAARPAAVARANAVQLHLRRFCLKRGATLVFVPTDGAAAEGLAARARAAATPAPPSGAPSGAVVKEEGSGGEEEEEAYAPSALLLQQYLLHRLYPAAFRYDAASFDFDPGRPDAELFLCAGQDSPALASQLELGALAGLSFHDAVPPPQGWAGPDEEESGAAQVAAAAAAAGTSAVSAGAVAGPEAPLEYDDSAWLANLRAGLSAAQAQRAVLAEAPSNHRATATPAAAAAATTEKPPPVPPPPARATKANAKPPEAAGAKDFFSSLLNS